MIQQQQKRFHTVPMRVEKEKERKSGAVCLDYCLLTRFFLLGLFLEMGMDKRGMVVLFFFFHFINHNFHGVLQIPLIRLTV